MEYFLYSLLALVAIFFIVIIARTLAFKPKKSVLPTQSDTDFDADRASECLRELVKFKTISYRDPSLEDEAEFEGLIGALPSLYPHVFEKCEFLRLPNRALLFKWSGGADRQPNSDNMQLKSTLHSPSNSLHSDIEPPRADSDIVNQENDLHSALRTPNSALDDSHTASGGVPGPNSEFDDNHSALRTPNSALEAVVLMAHYDVVPVSESDWEKPPFDGIIENGELWGRGTLDTKVTMNASLFAVDTLIARGYTPKRDIYLAYSGNEEINGEGAPTVIKYFEENGIKIGLVLDEGGAVCENVFPGVKAPCGMIGIAEKGMLDLEYKIKSNGGHASSPKPRSTVGYLADACHEVETHPFKMKMSDPVSRMFNTLGRHSTFLYRMIFSNWWAFGWVVNLLGKKSGGELNALIRTTVAFTQMKGSSASNVMPPEASMVSNIRLNPNDTVEGAVEQIRKTVKNDSIELNVLHGVNPSRISRVDCDEYRAVENAVASTWKGAIVTPYLMVQCSDSRHYGRISDKVYRFSAMDMTLAERRSVHGNNEKIRLSSIAKSCEFYLNLIQNIK